MLLLAAAAWSATLTVGPTGTWPTPCAAVAAASAGDTIEVDAAGTYTGDTCAWSTDDLTLRGVNGRARIDADGVAVAEQKGIFVIHAPRATIEGFELSGAAVADRNGAGIRHQGTDLVVRDCLFHDNENGILGSPSTDGTGEVTIERSEFRHNGAGDGQSHNLYLGHYARVTFLASYTHAGNVGHLFKSRALDNRLLYSRFSDEEGGRASYEIDLPNAGTTWIVGSIVEQVPTTENSGIVAYGEETSGMNAAQDLHVVNTTFVNHHDRGTFLGVGGTVTTPAEVVDTLFVGPGTLSSQAATTFTSCWDDRMGDAGLVDPDALDVHLGAGSGCIDAGVDPGDARPTFEYVHPASLTTRAVVGAAIDIGAYEFGNVGGDDTGTTDPATTDSTPTDPGTTDSTPSDSTATDSDRDGTSKDGGGTCGCASTAGGVPVAALLLAAFLARRRDRDRSPSRRGLPRNTEADTGAVR